MKKEGTTILDVDVYEGLYTECVGDSFELVILFNGAGIINIAAENIHTLVIQISGIRYLVLEYCLVECTSYQVQKDSESQMFSFRIS